MTPNKVASAIRPGLRQAGPSSPNTPQRTTSSTFSSPGSTFRHDEESVVFELGSRFVRAGFEGESAPQCTLTFGPEDSRRVADYRVWQPGFKDRPKKAKKEKEWDGEHELWRMDIRDLDLGLIEDKIERAVREAYNKYLLTDAGSQRLVLVLPSLVPHPLLSSILTTLFNRWKYATITLLPSPTMAAVAAGLRSALVVDIGWDETIVTGIYEYRELLSKRSTRAVKLLTLEVGKMLSKAEEGDSAENVLDASDNQGNDESQGTQISVDFDLCEEVVGKLAWCRNGNPKAQFGQPSVVQQLEGLSIAEDAPSVIGNQGLEPSDPLMPIPLSEKLSRSFTEIPFSKFAAPVEKALFAPGIATHELDDQEHPIDVLVYNTLLALSPDVRGACMSRIIFTGGGSHIPGVRDRILEEVAALVEKHGWSPIRGKAVDVRKQYLSERNRNLQTRRNQSQAGDTTNGMENGTMSLSPDSRPPEKDPVEESLRRGSKDVKPYVHGVLRQVESLGPWAGASLVASLKVKGLVEIDREKFLQHGLAGANREAEISVFPSRMTFGPGIKASAEDRSSWTLGAWG